MMSTRHISLCVAALLALLTPSSVTFSQVSCSYHLPYVQDCNNGFTHQTPHAGSAVDMTLVTEDNCWTQYIYRSIYTVCSMIAPNHTGVGDHALSLFAHHPMAGQHDRVEYT